MKFKPGDIIEYVEGTYLLVLPDNGLLRLSTGGDFDNQYMYTTIISLETCTGDEPVVNLQKVLKKVYYEETK